MSIDIRVNTILEPGAKLYCDTSGVGGSFEADDFARKYADAPAVFVGYQTQLIGPLDRYGRLPGIYIDPSEIKVRFDGEKQIQTINAHLFVVRDAAHARIASTEDEGNRIGDLPFVLKFYPGDLVMYRDKPGAELTGPHPVIETPDLALLMPSRGSEIITNDKGKPRYLISETDDSYRKRIAKLDRKEKPKAESPSELFAAVSGAIHDRERKSWYADAKQLKLQARGNAWALYNDPKALSFASDAAENVFWADEGVSRGVGRSIFPGLDFKDAAELFASGHADVIAVHKMDEHRRRHGDKSQKPTTFSASRLHGCFAEHRPRARALTERFWAQDLKK